METLNAFRSKLVSVIEVWAQFRRSYMSYLLRIIEEHLTPGPHDMFFEQVHICFEKGLYNKDIKEMNAFEHFYFWKSFFFTSQLSCSNRYASWKEKRNTFYNNHICILHSKI